MVDEHEAAARVCGQWWAGTPVLELIGGDQLEGPGHELVVERPVGRLLTRGTLHRHASERLGLGGLDGDVTRDIVGPLQDVLVLLRAESLEGLSASGRNEEEQGPQMCAHVFDAHHEFGQFGDGATGDRGVDLQPESCVGGDTCRVEGGVERAGETTEGIVDLGVGGVQ